LNTKQIEYILTLAEVGNFNRAAEQLFISQPTLTYQVKLVEQEIATGTIDYFTSADHDTTLTNVMAQKGIVIAQGFLHDPSDNLVWTPYDTNVVIQTVLCTHKSVDNPLLADLVKTLCRLHEDITQY
jgi:hypothetical protein